MVLLIHSMARPFAVHCQTVQLSGQSNRKVADVDHFLHLSQAFLQTFAHFIRDEFTKRIFELSQLLPKLPDNLSALRCRNTSPMRECVLSRFNDPLVVFLRSCDYLAYKAPVYR